MGLGPIELLVVGFPGNKFTGGIVPQLRKLVDDGIISVVDGLLITKDLDENVAFVEFEQIDPNLEVAVLSTLIEEANGLLSADDVDELAEALPPNCSAAALLFEHTWAKGLRDEILAAGGELITNVRIPGMVVDEVLAAVAEAELEEAGTGGGE
jgi:hypothetical protein